MTRTAALIAVAATLAAGCGSTGREAGSEPPAPLAVTTVTLAPVDLEQYFEAGGVVTATATATVAARILAPVQDVRVRAGDRVRPGDVLLTLDARAAEARTRQAIAAAEAAEQALVRIRGEQAAAAADHVLASAWHGRVSALRARESATAQEFDEATARLAAAAGRIAASDAAVEEATAQLAVARAAVDAARVEESFTVVRAPFAGTVTERFVDGGALATPGAPLVSLDEDGPRRVDARVDEARVGAVRTGDRVTVMVDTGQGEQTVAGVVAEVARAVAADQRAFTVKVSLPATAMPRTGSFARVRFHGDTRRGFVVPAGALRRHGQVTSVFVTEGDVARVRLVQVGETTDAGVEVVAGLDAGDLVVVAPGPALVDGRRISAMPAGGEP